MKREQLRHNPAGNYLPKKACPRQRGTYTQEDELYHVGKQQNTSDSVWLAYDQSGVFCRILRFSVGVSFSTVPISIHPVNP